jgi:hypothetical protein
LGFVGLVQGGVSLFESGGVEPDRNAGADHHFVSGSVVRTVAQSEDLGFGCINEFVENFGLSSEGCVIVNELKDFGRVHVFFL